MTQKDGNIWNKLQCKVTMISKHNLKDIHQDFYNETGIFIYVCIYVRHSLSGQNGSLSIQLLSVFVMTGPE